MTEKYGGHQKAQLTEMAKPFPKEFLGKDDRGNDAVDHTVVTQRLLQILGPYDLEVKEVLRSAVDGMKTKSGKEHAGGIYVTGAIVRLTVEIDGRRVSIEEVGGCENAAMKDGDGERMKHAISDAIKRASMRLGLGLSMWAQENWFLYDVLTRDQESESGGASNPTPKTEQATPTQEVGSVSEPPSSEEAEPKASDPGASPQAPVEEAASREAVSSGTAKKKAKPAERGETAEPGPGVWGSTPKSPSKSASLGGDLRSLLVNAVASGEIRNASVLSKSAKLCVTHNVMPPDGLGTIADIPDAILSDLVSELELSQESLAV